MERNRYPSTPRSSRRGTAAAADFGVKGGQNKVPRQRRVNRDMCGFGIAHLAHHDHVRILAHEGTQRRGEGQPDRGLDLGLIDAGQVILDRVFDGEDFAAGLVQDRQDRRQRRGLAASGRAGDDDHAVGQLQQTPELDVVGR